LRNILSFLLICILSLFILAGCSPSASKEELTKIKVSGEIQDVVNVKGQHKVVIWAENTSDKTFSGTVRVESRDVDGSLLGFDAFYPENLKPGEKKYGITWLKVAPTPKVFIKVDSGTFK